MGEQRPASYPSPNAAQVASPFFQQAATTSAQDVPAMISQELSAELARALHSEAQRHDDQSGAQIPALDLQQQLAQDAMGQLGPGHHDYGDEEDEISDGGTHRKRKRQKLSGDAANRQKNTRACDECRRKKVKCESEIGQELGIEACLACKKSGLQCQFSRVPQKRGPSRGYISKLDERLQNVESAIREYLPQAAHRIGRHEPVDPSAYDLSYAEDTPHPPSGDIQDGSLGFPSNGDSGPFWSSHVPKPAAQLPDLSAVKNAVPQDVDVHEDALSACYDRLQSTLPIFATDPLKQRRMLSQSSSTTRTAFTSALDCFLRAADRSRASVSPTDLKTASQLCLEAEFEPASATKAILLMQTYVLLSLAAQELGPSFAHAGSATSSQKLLSQANNLALGLDLDHTHRSEALNPKPSDSDAKMARRLHVVMYIIDRWLAIGFSSPFRVHVPHDRLVLLADDKDVLGQQCYQLARISTLLTQMAKSLPITHLSSSAQSPREVEQRSSTADLIQTLLDRTADDFSGFVGAAPLLQSAFTHAELIAQRLRPEPDVEAVTEKTLRLLETLHDTMASALGHNFAALCGLSIADIALHDQENKAVSSAAARLEQILNSRPSRDGSWEQSISNIIKAATAAATGHHDQDAMTGLHNLADAAVTGAAVQALQQPNGWDTAKLVTGGYLTLLVPKS